MFNRHFCTIVVPTSNSLAAKPFSVIWGPKASAGCLLRVRRPKVAKFYEHSMSFAGQHSNADSSCRYQPPLSVLYLSVLPFSRSPCRSWRRVVYNKWCNTHGCHFIIFSQKSKDKRPQNVGRAHSTEIRYLPFACCAKKFA